MPIEWTELSDGQLPNVEANLYTAPAATHTAVRTISVYNTGAVTTVTIYKRMAGGASRVLFSINLAAGLSSLYEGCVTLEPGGMIRGDDGGAGGARIDYVISGAEET